VLRSKRRARPRETTLTYFDFRTPGCLGDFCREALDAVILEVGLGGRLDAVNAFDADCALLSSVDLDHTDYLAIRASASDTKRRGFSVQANPRSLRIRIRPAAFSTTRARSTSG